IVCQIPCSIDLFTDRRVHGQLVTDYCFGRMAASSPTTTYGAGGLPSLASANDLVAAWLFTALMSAWLWVLGTTTATRRQRGSWKCGRGHAGYPFREG